MFDIAIIGGGHSGLEAAWIAAEFDLNVAIFSMPGVPLGSCPCNPSIGGVGKAQVVRELDALGGLMGRLGDISAIQYRVLNESKGHAVQSTRLQVDKEKYAENAEKTLKERSNINIIRKKISSINKEKDAFLISSGAEVFKAKKVVVTAGTFLNGKTHIGSDQKAGGRIEVENSVSLGDLFTKVKTLGLRFKTGTPARLDKNTINFEKMSEQKSDGETINFHWDHSEFHREIEQKSCYLTRTNEETLKIIRDNKKSSPLFNGQIKGVGPRYCPSIEDKAFRYLDRDVHHVFVEPEGLNLDTIYPNGISTSLPKEIQKDFINTIEGLENAEILVPGYAVEYDVVDTSRLNRCLEYEEISGLYFAGQVNGTSGYEEAAGQGYVAGVNAALSLQEKAPLIFDRFESYIGVMIEDLVTTERDEPYRLFTARSENRLYLREDNAVNRMAPYRNQLNLNSKIDQYQKAYLKKYDDLISLSNKHLFSKESTGKKDTLKNLITKGKDDVVITLRNILEESGLQLNERLIRAVAIALKYEGYMNKSDNEMRKIRKLERRTISIEEIMKSSNVSTECKQRIERIKPQTFGQLKRINGIRPATLSFVASHL